MLPLHPSSLSLRRYGTSPGSHSHPHFQVLWGWRGSLELEVEGRGSRVVPGKVAVIAPGDRHDFHAGAPERKSGQTTCFVFDGHDDRLQPLGGRVMDASPALTALLHCLAAPPVDPQRWQLAVPLILHSLPSLGVALPPPKGRRIDWQQLQAWVDTHLHLPLTVSDLAAQVHLSPTQFSARCQAQWGLPALAWVRQRRFDRAAWHRSQGMSVAAVARACGYRSPSALTAALRRGR